jgi:hypothetical protein
VQCRVHTTPYRTYDLSQTDGGHNDAPSSSVTVSYTQLTRGPSASAPELERTHRIEHPSDSGNLFVNSDDVKLGNFNSFRALEMTQMSIVKARLND